MSKVCNIPNILYFLSITTCFVNVANCTQEVVRDNLAVNDIEKIKIKSEALRRRTEALIVQKEQPKKGDKFSELSRKVEEQKSLSRSQSQRTQKILKNVTQNLQIIAKPEQQAQILREQMEKDVNVILSNINKEIDQQQKVNIILQRVLGLIKKTGAEKPIDEIKQRIMSYINLFNEKLSLEGIKIDINQEQLDILVKDLQTKIIPQPVVRSANFPVKPVSLDSEKLMLKQRKVLLQEPQVLSQDSQLQQQRQVLSQESQLQQQRQVLSQKSQLLSQKPQFQQEVLPKEPKVLSQEPQSLQKESRARSAEIRNRGNIEWGSTQMESMDQIISSRRGRNIVQQSDSIVAPQNYSSLRPSFVENPGTRSEMRTNETPPTYTSAQRIFDRHDVERSKSVRSGVIENKLYMAAGGAKTDAKSLGVSSTQSVNVQKPNILPGNGIETRGSNALAKETGQFSAKSDVEKSAIAAKNEALLTKQDAGRRPTRNIAMSQNNVEQEQILQKDNSIAKETPRITDTSKFRNIEEELQNNEEELQNNERVAEPENIEEPDEVEENMDENIEIEQAELNADKSQVQNPLGEIDPEGIVLKKKVLQGEFDDSLEQETYEPETANDTPLDSEINFNTDTDVVSQEQEFISEAELSSKDPTKIFND